MIACQVSKRGKTNQSANSSVSRRKHKLLHNRCHPQMLLTEKL